MAYHTFGPGLALDQTTMKGIPAMIAYLEDADTGEPVQALTMDTEPVETSVITNRYGYFGMFQVPDTVSRLRMKFGTLELVHAAWETIIEAKEAAEVSAQAALDAASLVEAPADEVVATLATTEGSDTKTAFDAAYGEPAIVTKINSPSDIQAALDARFGNSAVAGFVTNAGATQTALDSRFNSSYFANFVTNAGATRTALDARYGTAAMNTATANALGIPGAVRDALDGALEDFGMPRVEDHPGARLIYGALRNTGAPDYWQPIDDSGHYPAGIQSVTTTESMITITAKPVANGRSIAGGTLIAVTDETLAKLGYFVGGSGGGSTTNLMLGRSRQVSDRIYWDGSQFVQESGDNFTLSWSSPNLTIVHNEPPIGRGGCSIIWHGTGSGAPTIPAIVAETEAQTVVSFYSTTARITSPTSACRFYITRQDSMDPGQVDPRTVTHTNSNIWFVLIQTYKP